MKDLNIVDITLIIFIVGGLIAAAVHIYKRKKFNKSTCSGNCASCASKSKSCN